MSYHAFQDEDGDAYGSFEVFYVSERLNEKEGYMGSGWYWWPCFPGCLPDGDPIGPFATELEAINDAKGG